MNLRAVLDHPRGSPERASSHDFSNIQPPAATLEEESGCYTLRKTNCAQGSDRSDAPGMLPSADMPVSRVLRRSARAEPLRPLKLGAVLAIAAAHLFAATELTRCLVALSPLLIIALARRVGSADVYAGAAAIMIAIMDQLNPLTNVGAELLLGVEPHRLIPLGVIALLLIRLRRAQIDLVDLSRRDALTGLLNRRGFETLAEKELGRAARYRRPLAFALIDLDHFKEINDRFGHAQGDEVLRAVATELANLRAFDLPVRLGGDEFGLLMPETDEAAAERVVTRLAQRLRERLKDRAGDVSMSVGIATSGAPPRPLSELMLEADRRMYTHKHEEHQAAREYDAHTQRA
jgi:diguanylate cyclase (GGDEF)-like protein